MQTIETEPKVYIVVLNYKGWQDTIACLESLFKQTYTNYHIILVDNCSPDDSVNHIKDWADGRIQARVDEIKLIPLIEPPSKKPIKYELFLEDDLKLDDDYPTQPDSFTIIVAKSNRGFSAGNNIGLKYAIAQKDSLYYWLLNNDTLVTADTLNSLVECHKQRNKLRKTGIVGGKLLYYHQPHIIQCLGGATYNPYFGLIKQVGNGLVDEAKWNNDNNHLDYVSGACMLVDSNFIQEVGLLAEDYFLYYEEIDWCTRGRNKGWEIAYTTKAIVYHKEGATSGASTRKSRQKSEMADYYYVRNKLLYTSKYKLNSVKVVVRLSLIATIINRIIRGQFKRALLVIQFTYKNI